MLEAVSVFHFLCLLVYVLQYKHFYYLIMMRIVAS